MVSLESAERPNYFLAVSGRSRLQLEQWSRGVEFSRRATFIQHQGLFLPGYTSFELVSQPGVFLTLTRNTARAQRYDTSEGFKASSSITLEGQKHKRVSNNNTVAPKYNLRVSAGVSKLGDNASATAVAKGYTSKHQSLPSL